MFKKFYIDTWGSIYSLKLFYKIVILILLLWSIAVSILAQTAGVILFVLVLLILVVVFNHSNQHYTGYFALSLVVTSVFMVIIFYIQIYLTGSSLFFVDSSYYLKNINELATNYRIEYLVTNNPIDATYNFFGYALPQTGFIYLIGTVTKVFCGSPNLLFYNFLVAAIGSLVVLMTVKIAAVTTKNEKIVKISAYITMLFPVFIIHSVALIKETLVLFLICAIAYNILTINKKTIVKSIFLALLFAYFLFTRYRVGIVLIVFCIGVYALPWNEKLTFRTIGKSVKNRWYIILICLVSAYLIYKFCYSADAEISSAAVKDIPETNDPNSLSSMLKYAYIEGEERTGSVGFWGIVYKIPVGLRQIFMFFYALFHPFNFYSVLNSTNELFIRNVFTDLGTLFWLAFVPSFIVGSYKTLKSKDYNNFNVYFVVAIIAIMAIVLYVGVRWKLMVWPFMGILIAIGIIHKKEYKKLWIVSSFCTAFITLAYLALNIFLG